MLSGLVSCGAERMVGKCLCLADGRRRLGRVVGDQCLCKVSLSLSFFVQYNDQCILTAQFAADALGRTIDLIWRIHYKAQLRAVRCLCKAFILCL